MLYSAKFIVRTKRIEKLKEYVYSHSRDFIVCGVNWYRADEEVFLTLNEAVNDGRSRVENEIERLEKEIDELKDLLMNLG